MESFDLNAGIAPPLWQEQVTDTRTLRIVNGELARKLFEQDQWDMIPTPDAPKFHAWRAQQGLSPTDKRVA